MLSFKQLGSHKVIPLSDPDRLVIDISNGNRKSVTGRDDSKGGVYRTGRDGIAPPSSPFSRSRRL
ncbi:MAG: hypothetical protein MPW15_04170 [Candidatus Manganitrophus sp.]|nr:hypothetical protein [Candidatus Manganitrophus sp.]